MSSTRRFYIPGVSKADRLPIDSAEARHMTRVMRLGIGDDIIAFDGTGCECLCRISEMSGRSIIIQVIRREEVSREAPVEVTLAIAATRNAAMDIILRMCTELGLSRLLAFESGRSVARMDNDRIDKWRRTTIEAAKQCGRNVLPELTILHEREDLCKLAAENDLAIVADISPSARPLSKILCDYPQARRLMYVIGPEGGFSQEELEPFQAAGMKACTLGPSILRVETAAVAALAMILTNYT